MAVLNTYQRVKLSQAADDVSLTTAVLREFVVRYVASGGTPTEVAKWARVSRATVYRWVEEAARARGALPGDDYSI